MISIGIIQLHIYIYIYIQIGNYYNTSSKIALQKFPRRRWANNGSNDNDNNNNTNDNNIMF